MQKAIFAYIYMSLFDTQYKTNPTIFSRKKIAAAAQVYRIDTIVGIEEKKQKLAGWINGIKDGTITSQKAEALCNDFLNLFFGELLDYDYKQGEEQTNLEKQLKNQSDGKKSDGALGYFNAKTSEKLVRAVIEIKDGQTDLDKPQNRKNDHRTPVQQAFDYASDAGGTCNWVIVSNFVEIRLYNYRDRGKYELFYITEFLDNEIELQRFYYLMYKTQLISKFSSSSIDRAYEQRQAEQLNISNKFYGQYKQLRLDILANFRSLNPEKEPLWLLEKTQKLLDRVIFVCFCEDTVPELIPGDTIKKMLDTWRNNTLQNHKTLLWQLSIGLFHSMDKGNDVAEIQPFNGGLFATDAELDALKIDSHTLVKVLDLHKWDFESELNVNILGHIFEQSISDLEDLQAQLSNNEIISEKVRKKDGVFYTPEYITKYMIEETIGTWLDERKKELNFDQLTAISLDEYIELSEIKKASAKKKKELNEKFRPYRDFWLAYKSKLDSVTILDPACGSGAFLIQVFDYLFTQQKIVGKEIERLFPEIKTDWWEVQRQILMNNLYGVDLNFESVEITKLSLWIKTANKTKPLSFIDNTIKCGNSLIDDLEIAGKKAFDWKKEFPQIFEKGGFDIVVGNPPYGGKLSIEQQKYILDFYLLGTSETASVFIKRAFEISNNKGAICFIIPKAFTFASNYISTRSFVFENIIKIADCGKVWSEVKLEQVIVEFNKTKIIDFYKSTKRVGTEFEIKSYVDKSALNTFGLFLNSVDKSEIKVAEKLASNSVFLNSEICTNSRGAMLQKHLKKSGKYKVIGGINIHRYGLNGIKGFLDSNSVDKKAIILNNSVLVQNIISHVKNPSEHILITAFLPKNLDLLLLDTMNQLAFVPEYSNKYVWIILNSKLINWYVFSFIYGKAIRTMHFDSGVTKRIPIKKLSKESQLPFIQKADEMLLLNAQFQKEKDVFFKTFTQSFPVSKIKNKLENWHESSFLAFQTELKKVKIEIPIKERSQWIELFEQTQVKIKSILNEISKTDAEINAMVYKLYDLSEVEIKVVEGK